MNLEDVIDPEYGLQQDDWSLTKPRFGKDLQLEVVGWSGKRQYIKLYIVRCSVCSSDPEIFGGGYFKSSKGDLVRGQIPCGCSTKVYKTKEQYAALCKRAAANRGYTFVDFVGKWRGSRTKVKLLCDEHGEWSSAIIGTLLSMANGCPGCGRESVRKASMKSDEEMTASFFASGAFHPDTKFWRSDRKDRKGWYSYWNVFCPDCNEHGESFCSNLRAGKRCCACSEKRQTHAYVNAVYDGDVIIALKFGVATKARRRLAQQNKKAIFDIENKCVYKFYSVDSCKKAERECLQELECGILSKQDMPDGWTETTWVYNLGRIIQIYERNGGVLCDQV